MTGIGILLVSVFTVVQLNCENLFDCRHDTLKADTEFLPDGTYHWTRTRYWRKLNHTGQTILSCGEDSTGWQLPDLVALCEVENDSVLHDLTRRSLLRKARYKYVMTASNDARGIDVALMYAPFSFALIKHHAVRVPLTDGMRPTRDILYAAGVLPDGDTLHVLVAHFPSRRGGEAHSAPFRLQAARTVIAIMDSVRQRSPSANILVAGDLNDYTQSESVRCLQDAGLCDVSAHATGKHDAKGTYRYHGEWGSLDHILVSAALCGRLHECFIQDAPFLTEEDTKYGGRKPRRTYLGPRYMGGYSDHLPLVARFRLRE